MTTLVVVESPAKQKTISKILGPKYIVRATVGHIMDLAKGKEDKLGVDIDNGFKPKYVVIPDKKDKIAAIFDAAKQSDLIYIASDPDREGEAIAWHVANQIKKLNKPIKRVLFKEITKHGINTGISNPGDLDKDLYDSQQARRVLDRLVGFLVSPYLWDTFGPKLSAGRVQSVCLRLIVDREREIENFVPEEYWNITAALAKDAKADKFVAKYTKKVTDEKTANKIKTDLDSSTFVIQKIEAKEQLRHPYPPLTTAKLQQLASARFKFSTKRTMSAAQSLYEQGYVTYIRTDSTRSDPGAINNLREWLVTNSFDVPNNPNIYKTKGTAQDAHEAIRPTDINLKFVSGNDDQSKLYKLIWERFVASQMKPAIYDTVSVTVMASKGHELKANGRTLKYSGWLAIAQDFESKKDEDVTLPILKEKDNVVLVKPKVVAEKKQTQPPPRYTEGALVKDLEKKGIGRPSTYASIIGKISDRNYVIKTKNSFTPTELGCRIVDDLKKHFSFLAYEYTNDIENKLDSIEIGKASYIDIVDSFFTPFKSELKNAHLSKEKDGGKDCDICGKRMKLRHGKFGYYIACPDYPKCKNSQSVTLENDNIIPKNNREIIEGIQCPECNSGMYHREGKFGPFYSCSNFPKCNGKRRVPFGKKCPKCQSELFLTYFKGEPKLACMGYPNCKNIEEVPPGSKISWVDPQAFKKKKKTKIDKIIEK